MAQQFPAWIRRPWASGDDFGFTKDLLADLELHTVCQSAQCPNLAECWAHRTATVMIMGNTCTRNCAFCSVPSGQPGALDSREPRKVAEAVRRMNLRHAVVTTVVRDDLPDGGAGHIAATIRAIREQNPETTVEILISEFSGDAQALETVLDARPEVFGHNIETVERLYPVLRDRRFSYATALQALRVAADRGDAPLVKSALMVGHGETPDEVRRTLEDVVQTGCEAVCIGQYLRPTRRQREVAQYVAPEQFKEYEALAYAIGFTCAVAGPFVRSSYRADEMLRAAMAKKTHVAARRL
jgi:lipoyl synthase